MRGLFLGAILIWAAGWLAFHWLELNQKSDQKRVVIRWTPLREVHRLAMGLLFLVLGLVVLLTDKGEPIAKLLISGLFVAVAGVSAWLSWQYRRHDRAARLYVYPAERRFRYTNYGRVLRFEAADVKRITIRRSSVYKAPWASYQYACLALRNGQTLSITSLLVLPETLAELFPKATVHCEFWWICWFDPKQAKAQLLAGPMT
ncbi:hypothetical protein F0P96_09470 [Hymenobacter busanensis]|uniref:PH domain-containing protein n=1 Tax=Hymenobacter busanensis TaxID=2607656 RepID=A0A7L4ZX89_9BACT|nr:hypothetical protein [Hymenobacter busanensis]KAA9333199.1 hypothetical protein F0P96_09470 [Hymenobacter busanensis]QHJ08124.1 hypothetical protein GUY19_12850 [Hymenobacter busanensis]